MIRTQAHDSPLSPGSLGGAAGHICQGQLFVHGGAAPKNPALSLAF